MAKPTAPDNKIRLIVTGAEGDDAEIRANVHQHLRQVLQAGLHALYGEPGPESTGYDVVIAGNVVTNLDATIEEAGLTDGDEIAILPRDVSRG